MSDKSKLFEPIQLRGLKLPNRIMFSPMCMYSARNGMPTPFHHRHIGSYAESGVGLVVMEATAVDPTARLGFGCLGLWSDEHEAAFKRLLTEIRMFSETAIGIQLGHAGRKAGNDTDRRDEHKVTVGEEGSWQCVGPMAEAYKEGWTIPTELDRAGMDGVRDAFIQAASRAVRCGFDLIEIHSAHGYLLQSFLSPLTNRRTDEYGGSRENRMRFPLEVIAALRAALPSGFPLGVRTNGHEWTEGGVTLDDSVAYAGRLKDLGVDYVTASSGGIVPGIAPPPHGPGYMVHFAQRIRKDTGITTVAVGGIVTADQAEAIVGSGQADMVAVGRALLDDPRWGFHAAAALGVEVPPPDTYRSVSPKNWPLYRHLYTR